MKRRGFLKKTTAVVAAFTIPAGCMGNENLADNLLGQGAILRKSKHNGRTGEVVVGWQGSEFSFPQSGSSLKEGDRIFMIHVDGQLVTTFLEDTYPGNAKVEVRSTTFKAS